MRLLILFLFIVLGTFFVFNMPTRCLPLPPDFSILELDARIEEYGSFHIAACEVCKQRLGTGELPPPSCYYEAISPAYIVGSWKAVGCSLGGRLLWEYVGRDIPGYKWGTARQRWLKEKII